MTTAVGAIVLTFGMLMFLLPNTPADSSVGHLFVLIGAVLIAGGIAKQD